MLLYNFIRPKLFFIILISVIASSCAASPQKTDPSDPVIWVGSSSPFGFGEHLQLSWSSQDETAALDIYGSVVLGFDALYRRLRLASYEASAERLFFKGTMRGKEFSFSGEVDGSIAAGDFVYGETTSTLTLTRLSPSNDDILGLYDDDGREQILTWREGGGFRLIDIQNGKSKTLLTIGDDVFTTPSALLPNVMGAPRHYNIIRNPLNEIAALNGWSEDGAVVVRSMEYNSTLKQVKMEIEADGAMLRGTLLLPALAPQSVIVFVHGSGPIYRTALAERAANFVAAGHAAFIYDKRGVGESGGKRNGDDLFQLADDLAVITRALRKETSLDGLQIGVQGHSQAGWVIPLASGAGAAFDFAIVVNGGGVDISAQTLFDKKNDLIRAGYDGITVDEALSLLSRMHTYIRDKTEDNAKLESDYLEAQDQPWFGELDLPRWPALPSWDGPPNELVYANREMNIDPLAINAAMSAPVLVLLGADDETVSASAAESEWTNSFAVKQGDHDLNTIIVLDGVGHNMRTTTPDGNIYHHQYYRAQYDWISELPAH